MDLSIRTILPVFLVAFVVSLLMTPVSMKIAGKIGAIDIPKDSRRMHKRPIPRFGGLAIFAGSMVSMALFEGTEPKIRIAMVGGTLIYILGIVDDLKDLPAWVKFIAQTAVAVLMYFMGVKITFIANYFGPGLWRFSTVACFVITVLWIVGVTNTINLIDGLDGLAAGTTAIAASCMAYIAYIHGDVNGMIVVCFALIAVAGSCLGFLPYNFSPAKTFMGDGGALYLGFMVAIMSVIGPLKRTTLIAVVLPIIVLAIPLFDTFFAIARRMWKGQNIMEADKGHLHHRLIQSGFGQKRAVLMLYGISGIMGMAAVLISRELYKDALFLCIIAGVYVYVFMTDPSRRMPDIKAVKITEDEETDEKTGSADGGKKGNGR